MPLDFIELVEENIHFGVWKITEEESFLHKRALLSDNDEALLEEIHHPTKRLEFLAGRSLIQKLCDQLSIPYTGMFRNEFGKPELYNSNLQVSLSHTGEFVVAIIGDGVNVGIDIEKPQVKMQKIASRLYSQEELAICGDSLELISKIWSAKEVLFKIFMVGEIDFKKHLKIYDFNANYSSCKGVIYKNDFHQEYTLQFKSFNGYYICFNVN